MSDPQVIWWKAIWCWLALNHMDPGIFYDDNGWRCKRCNMRVRP